AGTWIGRSVRIKGCLHEYGSDEGIPDETAETPEQTTPGDTVPGGTPMYHYFTIRDSADVLGLLHEGGCELRLDPVVGGKVHLTLFASGIGVRECADTTSVWVRPSVPSSW